MYAHESYIYCLHKDKNNNNFVRDTVALQHSASRKLMNVFFLFRGDRQQSRSFFLYWDWSSLR